jgi:hypothetical protein
MDSSFWLGKCVCDTHVMLWQKLGGSILGIHGVMRIARLDATVHRRAPVRTGQTVRRLCADGSALAATPVASIFMGWVSILLIIVPYCWCSFKYMVYDSARKAIALITKRVTKKATSKKKSKDLGTSKRRHKDDTSEEEEEPDNPNDSDFDPTDRSASATFMVEEEEINQGGGNIADIIDVLNYTVPRRQWTQREFAIARNANAYDQPHDTYNLFFRTTVQEQAFFSI